MHEEMSVDFRGKKYNPLVYKFRNSTPHKDIEEYGNLITTELFDLFNKFYSLVQELTTSKRNYIDKINDGKTENVLALNLFWVHHHAVLGDLEFICVQNNKYNCCNCQDPDCVWEDHSRYVILISRNKEEMLMYDNKDDILFISDEFVNNRIDILKSELHIGTKPKLQSAYASSIIISNASKSIN